MTLYSFHRLHRSSVPRSGRVWCGHSVVSARGLGLARGLWRAHTPPHTCPHMPLTRVSRCVGTWHTTPLADPQRTGTPHLLQIRNALAGDTKASAASIWARMGAGLLSGCIGILVANPTDVVKVGVGMGMRGGRTLTTFCFCGRARESEARGRRCRAPLAHAPPFLVLPPCPCCPPHPLPVLAGSASS